MSIKTYSIEVKVVVSDKSTTYPVVSPIDFSIRENMPRNTDPQQYLRKRIAEEIARAFNAGPSIENSDQGVEHGPLA